MFKHTLAILFSASAMLTGFQANAQLSDPISEPIEFGSLTLRVVDWVQIPNSDGRPAQINVALPSPDESGRVFVNDQRGYMYVIENDVVAEYFDVYSVLTNATSDSFFGTGLQSFVFHPDFAHNGKFYTVHMEARSTGTPDFFQTETTVALRHHIVTEWTASDPTANTFSGSHFELLRIEAPTFNHGVQQLGFNPTVKPGNADYGMLYIAHGDGDQLPSARAQTLNSLHGSILRLDTYGNNSSNGLYGIPGDNPFANDEDPDTLGEIWAYGFRNPHRISWDSLTGTMYVGDIGENQVEEINIVEAGANYGWNEREGTFLFDQSSPGSVFALPANDQNDYKYPVLQYDHDEGRAVVGGYVYRGSQIPELYGTYLFGDIFNGYMFYAAADSLVQGQQTTIQRVNIVDAADQPASLRSLTNSIRVDLKYGIDANDEILILTKADGKVRRLESALQQPDEDGDGTADANDNCRLVSNADQRDSNGDGFGNVCDPDLNNDNIINFIDFAMYSSVFGKIDQDADFNGDGAVNFIDLAIFADYFLLPPGP